ncbi:hypothetical protein Tco_0797153 [Tanacetum coccineum]
MSTPIDFSAFDCLKINNLTKVDLVGSVYNLLKDFFFNNDFEYLGRGSNAKKYTASTTKSKAAMYELKGIEDMVPNLWSPIKIVYDRYPVLGISIIPNN